MASKGNRKGGRSSSSNRGGKRSSNSGGGFPSWGIYALGGLAIAGIIYGLSKYGPTGETLSGWIDSANDLIGGSSDDDYDTDVDDFDTDSVATGTDGEGSVGMNAERNFGKPGLI